MNEDDKRALELYRQLVAEQDAPHMSKAWPYQVYSSISVGDIRWQLRLLGESVKI